jgi:hypothetical protein
MHLIVHHAFGKLARLFTEAAAAAPQEEVFFLGL